VSVTKTFITALLIYCKRARNQVINIKGLSGVWRWPGMPHWGSVRPKPALKQMKQPISCLHVCTILRVVHAYIWHAIHFSKAHRYWLQAYTAILYLKLCFSLIKQENLHHLKRQNSLDFNWLILSIIKKHFTFYWCYHYSMILFCLLQECRSSKHNTDRPFSSGETQ